MTSCGLKCGETGSGCYLAKRVTIPRGAVVGESLDALGISEAIPLQSSPASKAASNFDRLTAQQITVPWPIIVSRVEEIAVHTG
jgi:hypothetical protein